MSRGGVVVADAGYGVDGRFRAGLTKLGLKYAAGVQSSITVWAPGTEPLPPSPRKQMGRPPSLLRRDKDHQPVSVKQLASDLPAKEWKTVNWRQGTGQKLRSRFAAVRVRPAHRDYWKSEPHAEEWLLIEWPKGEAEPAKYWLSTLPADTKLKDLVAIAKQRWIIERDYEELKQELGLGHSEGRVGGDFIITPHSASPLTAFWLQSEAFFPPPPAQANWDYAPRHFLPTSSHAAPRVRAERHNPASIATIRLRIARSLIHQLPCSPLCCQLRL